MAIPYLPPPAWYDLLSHVSCRVSPEGHGCDVWEHFRRKGTLYHLPTFGGKNVNIGSGITRAGLYKSKETKDCPALISKIIMGNALAVNK